MSKGFVGAPAVNVVAWRGASGWTSWHLEYTAEQGRTLCLRRVPQVAVTRTRVGDDPTCDACTRVLDYETAKRLRGDTRPAA